MKVQDFLTVLWMGSTDQGSEFVKVLDPIEHPGALITWLEKVSSAYKEATGDTVVQVTESVVALAITFYRIEILSMKFHVLSMKFHESS